MNKEQLATVTDEYGNQVTTSPEAAALANLGNALANGMRRLLVSDQAEPVAKQPESQRSHMGKTTKIQLADGKELWL